MSHYQTSLVLEANPVAVYAALTTPEGLRGWSYELAAAAATCNQHEERT